jgi:hypothetical protein
LVGVIVALADIVEGWPHYYKAQWERMVVHLASEARDLLRSMADPATSDEP